MKVRCIAIISEDSSEVLESSSWISVGKEYTVLSVNMEDGQPIKFQLIGNDGKTPAYHNADQFETVSDLIPSSWIIDFNSSSHMTLSPQKWCKSGFWEDYFNDLPYAVDLFELEKENMFNEES